MPTPQDALQKKNANDPRYPFRTLAAVAANDADFLKKFLKDKKNDPNQVNNLDRGPVHLAVENESGDDIFDVLLTHRRVDPNLRDNSGATPVYLAVVFQKHAQLDSLLKSSKVDITLADRNGKTPYDGAKAMGNTHAENELAKRLGKPSPAMPTP